MTWNCIFLLCLLLHNNIASLCRSVVTTELVSLPSIEESVRTLVALDVDGYTLTRRKNGLM